MCGIVGFYNRASRATKESLLKSNETLVHRGPDAAGAFFEDAVGLAMRRLKVIDLATGDQPQVNHDKTLWIVFNGEIYNYRELRAGLTAKGYQFKTQSDTEVILNLYAEYGKDCLDMLSGMFAFCVYDVKRQSFFIARDRLGIKPLYYFSGEEGFAFASEIKALVEIPWVKTKISHQNLSHYFSLNYLPPPLTPFEQIHQLDPGHFMEVSRDDMSISRYWDIGYEETIDDTEEAALKRINDLLHQSVERRLVADVPLGAFLSGGLDSSALVALLKEHKEGKIKTFSVGFEQAEYDETGYARQVANYFGTEHHEIVCKAEDVKKHLPHIAWHADNLLADQAALPLYMVSKLAKEHVSVAFSGDGGDELFAGYTTVLADQYHQTYQSIPRFLRRGILEPLVKLIPSTSGKVSLDYKLKKFIEASDYTREQAHASWRTIFNLEEKAKLMKSDVFEKLNDRRAFGLYEKYLLPNQEIDLSQRALYADLKVWLVGNNLCKVDTMSMAHGLEARVPFLDHELVSYVSRLPFKLKFQNGKLKYLLKKLMLPKLPKDIVTRKKAGFHTPIAAWLKNELFSYAQEKLTTPESHLPDFIDKSFVANLLEQHQQGRDNHSYKIWSLFILNEWARAIHFER